MGTQWKRRDKWKNPWNGLIGEHAAGDILR